MATPENPFRKKLTEAQRRQVVEDVRGGLQIERAAEKYGISSAAVWNLVYRAAFRELVSEAGLPGLKPQEYLQHRANNPNTDGKATPPGKELNLGAIAEAARAAAAALQRLANLAPPPQAPPLTT
jgi:acyl-CoA synthetase (NDP forming)